MNSSADSGSPCQITSPDPLRGLPESGSAPLELLRSLSASRRASMNANGRTATRPQTFGRDIRCIRRLHTMPCIVSPGAPGRAGTRPGPGRCSSPETIQALCVVGSRWVPRLPHVARLRVWHLIGSAPQSGFLGWRSWALAAGGSGGGRAGVVGAGRLANAQAPHHHHHLLSLTLRHGPPPPPPALRSCWPGRSGSLRLTLSARASIRPAGAARSLSARRSVFPRPRVQLSLQRPPSQTAL